MFVGGSSGWEQGLHKGEREVASRAGRSEDRIRSRMAANAGVDEDPGEPLVCPRCRRSQPTGLYCPHCDVELVGESFVDVAGTTTRPTNLNWVFVAVVATGVGGLLLGLAYTIFGG